MPQEGAMSDTAWIARNQSPDNPETNDKIKHDKPRKKEKKKEGRKEERSERNQ